MALNSHSTIYETIGHGYAKRRQPDPRIAHAIQAALGNAMTVCNVGAGAGSYEPSDRTVTAVEPSQTMIDQRTSSCRVICSSAENLPFADSEFHAAMAILSVHHWTNPRKGLAEMKRISNRQVVFTFDPSQLDSLWLVRDYLPEIIEFERGRALPVEVIADCLGAAQITEVPIPHDCTDGFQAAYWRRPELYLEADVQATISTLAQLPPSIISPALNKLRSDLESGAWHKRYSHLLTEESMDFGYRIIVADKQG